MKSRLPFVPLLAVAVMMTANTAFAAPTSNATPLKGSWDSSEIPTFVPAPPPDAVTMYVDGDASGNATHLGKYTAKFEATVNLACGCSVGDTVHLPISGGRLKPSTPSARSRWRRFIDQCHRPSTRTT
jgi:hypothetical protein